MTACCCACCDPAVFVKVAAAVRAAVRRAALRAFASLSCGRAGCDRRCTLEHRAVWIDARSTRSTANRRRRTRTPRNARPRCDGSRCWLMIGRLLRRPRLAESRTPRARQTSGHSLPRLTIFWCFWRPCCWPPWCRARVSELRAWCLPRCSTSRA